MHTMLFHELKTLTYIDLTRFRTWWGQAPFVRFLIAFGIAIFAAIAVWSVISVAPLVKIPFSQVIAYTTVFSLCVGLLVTVAQLFWQRNWLASLRILQVSPRANALSNSLQSFVWHAIIVTIVMLPLWLYGSTRGFTFNEPYSIIRSIFAFIVVILSAHFIGSLVGNTITGISKGRMWLFVVLFVGIAALFVAGVTFLKQYLAPFPLIAQFIITGTLWSAIALGLFLLGATILFRILSAGSFEYAADALLESRPVIRMPQNEAWYLIILTVSILLLVLILRGVLPFGIVQSLPRVAITLFLYGWISLLTASFLFRTVGSATRIGDFLLSALPYFCIGSGLWLALPYLNYTAFRMVGLTVITQLVMTVFFFIPRQELGATKKARLSSIIFIATWVLSLALLFWQI